MYINGRMNFIFIILCGCVLGGGGCLFFSCQQLQVLLYLLPECDWCCRVFENHNGSKISAHRSVCLWFCCTQWEEESHCHSQSQHNVSLWSCMSESDWHTQSRVCVMSLFVFPALNLKPPVAKTLVLLFLRKYASEILQTLHEGSLDRALNFQSSSSDLDRISWSRWCYTSYMSQVQALFESIWVMQDFLALQTGTESWANCALCGRDYLQSTFTHFTDAKC